MGTSLEGSMEGLLEPVLDCLLEMEVGASSTEGRRLPEMPDGRRAIVVVVEREEGGRGVGDWDDKMERYSNIGGLGAVRSEDEDGGGGSRKILSRSQRKKGKWGGDQSKVAGCGACTAAIESASSPSSTISIPRRAPRILTGHQEKGRQGAKLRSTARARKQRRDSAAAVVSSVQLQCMYVPSEPRRHRDLESNGVLDRAPRGSPN